MEVIKAYPPQVKEWVHAQKSDFEGDIEEPAEQYILEITPPDPADKDFIYLNVTIEKKILNPRRRLQPFSASLYFHFKVKANNETPTPEFYFSLIETAAVNFAIYFYEKVKKTNLKGHKIKKPYFVLLKNDIQKAVDTWNRLHKYIS